MKRTRAWTVYIVRCRDGTLYTGITTDLVRRLRQHNAGKASRYTRCRLPVVLVYCERGLTQSSALRREGTLKSLTRHEKEQLIRTAA